MQVWKRGASSAAGLAVIALVLAGCTSTARTNTANLNVIGQPAQAQPVQSSSVQQNSLPAIGAPGTPTPSLSGQPVLGGQQPTTTNVASNTNGSFVTVGTPMSTGVSSGPEGVWNVVGAGQTCRLNLPMTAKTGTNYYRASAPGCAIAQVAAVTGWQQVGSQLQLYDENGNLAAYLAPRGAGYTGTANGTIISLSR